MKNVEQNQSGSSAPHSTNTASAIGDTPKPSVNPSGEATAVEAPQSESHPPPPQTQKQQPLTTTSMTQHHVNASATSAPAAPATAAPATMDESSQNANAAMGPLASQPGANPNVDNSLIYTGGSDLPLGASTAAAPPANAPATETSTAYVSGAYPVAGADPTAAAVATSAGAAALAAVPAAHSSTPATTPAAGHLPLLHGNHDPASFESIDANLLSHESEDAIAASAAGLLNDVSGYDLDVDMAAAHPHHHPHQDMALEEQLFESTMESLVNLDEDVEVDHGKKELDTRGEGLSVGVGVGAASGVAAVAAVPAAPPDVKTPFPMASSPKPSPAAAPTAASAVSATGGSTLSPKTAIQPTVHTPSRPQPSPHSTTVATAVAPATRTAVHPSPTPHAPPPHPSENHLRRAILTNTYSPYIHPTDTSLSSARQRLRTAIEQTRQLRQAFTEYAYDKYRVILQPVPSSVEEITNEIEQDPVRAMQELAVAKEALRMEKEREKREGLPLQGSGVGGGGGKGDGMAGAASAKDDFDQFAYYGSGLNLVVLPEHPVEGSAVDFNKYSQRGPTDPMTGQRYEGVTSAAAAAAELVFDRVRRCHVARLDKEREGFGAGGMLAGGAMLSYGGNLAGNRLIAENLGPDMRKSPDVMISPALSTDSATGAVRSRAVGKTPLGQGQQQPQSTLLSLSPDAEVTRPDGKMTAVQAALISKGVGLKEMRMDPRMKAIHRHQRMGHVDPRYGLPPSGSLLPPLLGVRQIQQLKPVGVRESEARSPGSSAARGAIQTVLGHINNADDLKDKAPADVQHLNPPVSETTTSTVNIDAISAPLQETKAAVSTNASESDGPNNTESIPVILQSAEENPSTPKDKLSQSADSDIKAKRDAIDEISVQKRNQAEDISTTLGDGTPNQSLSEEETPKRLILIHPMRPEGLPSKIADTIADGKFYDACKSRKVDPSIPEEPLVEFLLSLGGATPIPETLISNLLVQTMDTKSFRVKLRSFIGNDVAASDARDVVIAAIKVWLWSEHEESFQKAFVANKKIESDSDCTWLLKVSVRKSVFALSRVYCEEESFKKSVPKSEIATIVSQALANKVVVDSNMSSSLPMVGNLVSLLDSLRMEALKAKTQERVLLAALLSRRCNVSEAFSDAYVSSVIRAGEALGHEEVCEIVQDEECRASTMLPYDFFCDHRGVWEEPCRPPTGYHPGITGDELVKRAHARAAFQKSMKKLQTRLGLRGGVSDGGPYCPVTPSSTPTPSPTAANTPNPATLYRSTSSTLKRKGSQILGETSLIIGAGATGLPDSLLNPPSNLSTPLTWDMNNSSNLPYGRHNTGDRPGIVSVGGPSFMDIKRRKTSHVPNDNKNMLPEGHKFTHKHRSTLEIEWGDVAKMFLSGGSRRNIFGKPGDMGIANLKDKGTIIAPFIKEFDFDSFASKQQGKEELISSDEDISDETVFKRHQEVLDGMKRKLDAALQKRQQQPPFQRTRKR